MARLPTINVSGAAVPSGFKHLSTTLLAAGAASITVSGLSTSNLLFRLTIDAKPVTDSVNLLLRVNNDSGANYDLQYMYGNAGSIGAQPTTGQTAARLSDGVQTLDNARSSLYVVLVGKALSGVRGLIASRGLLMETTPLPVLNWGTANWNNVAALISRFDLLTSSGNLAATTLLRVEGLAP